MTRNDSALVVDDQLGSVTLHKKILSKIGFTEIDGVTSVDEAINCLKKKSYDIVLCDWDMKPLEGPELLKFLKEAALTQKMPRYYFLTGHNRWDFRLSARELGADGFLIKPAGPGELLEKLSFMLKKY